MTRVRGRVSAFSYGGGVQSTACLVLAAHGEIPCDIFIFANVGEKAENPRTLTYVHEVAMPYAAAHGIELVEVRKRLRGGEPDDLMDRILRTERSLPFPVRMSNGAPGRRSCTAEFKIRVLEKEVRRRGSTKAKPWVVGLGISVDEIHRVRTGDDPRNPYQRITYPLIELDYSRSDCLRIIRDARLPQPPRSACFFCPFHSIDEWRRLKREQPDKFAEAAALEVKLNDRRDNLGKEHVWLTRFNRPITQVVDDQMVLDFGSLDNCETGYCLT